MPDLRFSASWPYDGDRVEAERPVGAPRCLPKRGCEAHQAPPLASVDAGLAAEPRPRPRLHLDDHHRPPIRSKGHEIRLVPAQAYVPPEDAVAVPDQPACGQPLAPSSEGEVQDATETRTGAETARAGAEAA